MKKFEKHIEEPFVKWCKSVGIKLRKMNGLGYRSWPDRMLCLPGRPLFIEFKRPGKKATELQAIEIESLRELGYDAQVFDNFEAAREYTILCIEQIRRGKDTVVVSPRISEESDKILARARSRRTVSRSGVGKNLNRTGGAKDTKKGGSVEAGTGHRPLTCVLFRMAEGDTKTDGFRFAALWDLTRRIQEFRSNRRGGYLPHQPGGAGVADRERLDGEAEFRHAGSGREQQVQAYENAAVQAFETDVKNILKEVDLTGSPTPTGRSYLFGQLNPGPGRITFTIHYAVPEDVFDPTGYGGYDWKLKPDGAKRINAAIKPLVLRLEASDYLELPELINNTISVELPENARKAYNQMERILMTQLAKGEMYWPPTPASLR